MIIDTSALIAVLTDEEGRDAFLDAIIAERGGIPAPARVEFLRVAGNQRFGLREKAKEMLASFERGGCATLARSEEHTSELQSLMRISYAVLCLKKKHTQK